MSLKDYQILGKLGSGSFGVVYKVKPKDGGEVCVIKEVEMKSMDKKMRQWAMNQVKIMKNINSEHIVKYHQSFIEKDKLYICMEYCSGGDLAQLLKGQMGKPLAQDTIWKFTLQIMLGLRDLHKKKILHRDIKTMNVFLTSNKQVRIGDLGVARTLTGDFASTVVGTPYYLSPEMCEEKPYNEKTDVWAMGCLIYQLCTGKHPFEGNSQAALALKIVVGKYPPLPTLYSPVTSWIVRSCLSVDYKRRPTIQYILSQPDVIKMANKLSIPLDTSTQPVQPEKVEIKPKPEFKQLQKIIKVEHKHYTPRNNEPKVIPKKNYGQINPNRKNSLDKSKEKSSQKSLGKIKQNKGSKKQLKANAIYNQIPKGIPLKKSNQSESKKTDLSGQAIKKWNVKNKSPNLNKSQETGKNIYEKDTQKKKQPLQPSKILASKPEEEKEKEKIELPLQTKPRKSVQELVDDDELFKDFGITPEKLTVMHDKVEFKKVSNINWNICDEPQQPIENKSIFKELPTIRTPSNCEFVAIQCKQIQPQEQDVAEQIDDNAPYKSNEQIPISDEQQSTLLMQQDKQIQEDSDLKKKEKLLLLQKKIFENEKRKQQLLQLKAQGQKQLLVKMDKNKLEQIINIIKEGSDQEIEKNVLKELNAAGGTAKFYKIFYWQIQIERCEETISKCKENIISIANHK